jgi:putative membrane protein
MIFILNWFISTLAIIISAYLLPGVIIKTFVAAFIAALVLGLVNAIIRPILIILTLPLNILTLGLFTLVINALMVMLTSYLVPGFSVINFWWALLFSLILSLISAILSKIKE